MSKVIMRVRNDRSGNTLLETVAGAGLLALVSWLLPIVLILRSDKTNGAEKLFWLLEVSFVSWFAWIFYALLAPLGEKR